MKKTDGNDERSTMKKDKEKEYPDKDNEREI